MPYVSGFQTVVRKDLQGGTRVDLLSVFLHKQLFTAFEYRVLLMNYCISVYFFCWLLSMTIMFLNAISSMLLLCQV